MEALEQPGLLDRLWIIVSHPFTLAALVFQVWMIVHAVMNKEWMWVLFIAVFPVLGAFWYFFTMYRGSASATAGFELPGAWNRKRIKELQAQIHHLDKAHHHSQLGDIYFQQGKLEMADASYRAALERDPQDLDTRAHYGQCLLRRKQPNEARSLLEAVVAENPKHDYGYTLMALAETYMALGQADAALATWQRVTQNHSYARARVQLAELLMARGEKQAAQGELREVLADYAHAPGFQRRRERVWISRARSLARQLG